jgi:DNA repair exonuclease SbcCD ATPase subunit
MKREDITKLFPDATKDQIDQILNINGADIAKAKGEADKAKGDLETYRADLETAQKRIQELEKAGNDLQAAKERATALETELNGLKDANRIRDIRAAVAKETGVPMELLTADSEDACKAQAKGIQDYAKGGNYPEVKDGGETPTPATTGTAGAWQNLISQINSNSN